MYHINMISCRSHEDVEHWCQTHLTIRFDREKLCIIDPMLDDCTKLLGNTCLYTVYKYIN